MVTAVKSPSVNTMDSELDIDSDSIKNDDVPADPCINSLCRYLKFTQITVYSAKLRSSSPKQNA